MTELSCQPYGLGQEGEGICLKIQMGSYVVLLDCGLTNLTPLLNDLREGMRVDLVLCSHAHPDHARGLWELHQTFPELPVYSSEVTANLLPLSWTTARKKDWLPFCQALPWRTPMEFADGLHVTLWPAGHLPGAACFLLRYVTPQRTYSLFYTGDFFLSNARLVDGLPLEELRGLKPDVLIIEGSYGATRFPHRRQQENQLAERVQKALVTQQCVLFPTPTLGLGQELLMLLRSHHHFTGRHINVWVDPAIATGCDAYLPLLNHFPSSVQNFARHQSLFWDERILPQVRRFDLNADPPFNTPSILIAHQGAPILDYSHHWDGPWLILLPQDDALGAATVGPTWPGGQEELPWLDTLPIGHQAGQLHLETYLLTTHSDVTGTTQLIHNLRPQHVVFVHGTADHLAELASLEELQNRYQLHLPSNGLLLELPVGDTFLQPAAPEAVYEGELTDTGDTITVQLPDMVRTDTRWSQFADTGLIEARWQGDDLVLRGLSQRELLNRDLMKYVASTTQDCCFRCRYFRGQRCWNQTSPLFGFRVTADGYCPAFTAASSGLPTAGEEEPDASLDHES